MRRITLSVDLYVKIRQEWLNECESNFSNEMFSEFCIRHYSVSKLKYNESSATFIFDSEELYTKFMLTHA